MRSLAAVLTCLAVLALAPGAHARDDSVTSFDGTKIVLSFFPAQGLAEGSRTPTVLIGHGFAQSRETNENSEGRADLFGLVGPGPFRRAGYNVLTWDARGFGQSGGTVQADSPDYEARDVQALLDYVARQPEAQLDGAGDPRVGMSGASYGGGVQFITAAIDRRVDVIAPDIAWNSLVTALFKDRAVKSGWGQVLFGAGTAAGLAPGLVGGETGALDPHIQSAYTEGLTTGGISEENRAWFEAHGPNFLLDRVRIPTFLIQGTVDTLFTPQEAIDNYATLEKSGRPLKMMWFCGGHGACTFPTSEPKRLENAVLSWFNRHLKRDSAVDTGAKFEWIADDGKWRTAGGYPLPATAPLNGNGSGTLPIAQTSDSGQPQIAATPAANAVNVPIARPSGDTHILGAPTLELTYSGTAVSTAPDDHVYAQILNNRTGQVVGNLVTPIPLKLDGTERTITRPLEPLAAAATKDSSYTLQITPSSGVYGPQRADGAVTFSRIHVELPTVDERAAAAGAIKPQFRVGSMFRRSSRSRSIRVALFATPQVRRVIVRMRDARRRQVGVSRPVTVNGRVKATIKLKRRLRPGRYTLTVSGRAAGGSTARLTRAVTIRR